MIEAASFSPNWRLLSFDGMDVMFAAGFADNQCVVVAAAN